MQVRRSDGAIRQTTLAYDPFGMAVASVTTAASNLPVMQTVTTLDPVSLDTPSCSTPTGPSAARRSTGSVGRPRRASRRRARARACCRRRATSASPTGRGGASEDDVRRSGRGRRLRHHGRHTATVYLDELGRELRTEVGLGASYGGATLVEGYRTYDSLGRVAFEADPFVSSDGAATAYGTSRYFQPTARPAASCAAGASGSDDGEHAAAEVFPTCFTHGYANHVETTG